MKFRICHGAPRPRLHAAAASSLLALLCCLIPSAPTAVAQPAELPSIPEATPPKIETLTGTVPLEETADLSTKMIEGIDAFLTQITAESVPDRARLWKRDFSSRNAYEQSVNPNRDHLRRILGIVDDRIPNPTLQYTTAGPQVLSVAETDRITVYEVRWPTLPGVNGEGLLLQPKGGVLARIIAVPDADQTPEGISGLVPDVAPETQFARRLAEAGCQVLVPAIISRDDQWSGSEKINRFTNQPHREWIYRQAYEMGRHVIGFEVQRLLAAVDCLEAFGTAGAISGQNPKIGIAGYGEGGLLAFYTAALDTRIQGTLVSGYFRSRQNLWEEPIYRNVFGLLSEFGDAEIASLIAPRTLVVEHSRVPEVDGPPPAREGRQGAAPGRITQPDFSEVQAEIQRTKAIFPADRPFPLGFVYGTNGSPVLAGSQPALQNLLEALGADTQNLTTPSAQRLIDARPRFDVSQRQKRLVNELVQFTQQLLQNSDRARDSFLWSRVNVDRRTDWNAVIKDYRRYFHDEIIGRLPPPSVGANPRSRKVEQGSKWSAYELVLDVYPGVYTWAYVVIPDDLRSGERRPVVVCQHGLEGLPEDMIAGPGDSGYSVYKGLAARLADRGFITVAPHNPYRGGDSFRVLQRKANPVKKTLFSVITGQHERLLQWLSAQTYIDPKRIAFYGLSYGGKTAMRVPALLDGYALSICSGDFNEWIWKNAIVDSPYSYLYTGEYEMPEFNLGNTFNYAEMAALIAPRPFMVERGHDDPVAPDEWVALEYAKVRRFYAKLAYPERTTIDFFDGGHTINGVGTFQFLYRHLDFTRR
ncbi:MAG: hypothetical protein RI897_486 [Verrucomicrobiota bacterium]|jgi:dienelactone hydrolase